MEFYFGTLYLKLAISLSITVRDLQAALQTLWHIWELRAMPSSHLLLLSCGCSDSALTLTSEAEHSYFISSKWPAGKIQAVALMYTNCVWRSSKAPYLSPTFLPFLLINNLNPPQIYFYGYMSCGGWGIWKYSFIKPTQWYSTDL